MELSSIISLNAEAIRCMHAGNFRKATSLFRAALSEIRRRLVQHGDDDMVGNKAILPHAEEHTDQFLQIRSIPLLKDTLSTKSSVYQDYHTFSPFYQALYMNTTDCTVWSSPATQNHVSAVILYNLGLLQHLKGIETPTRNAEFFNKSMQLYQMVSSILGQCTVLSDKGVGLLFLAVLNNAGSLHSYFYETRQAQQCLERMRPILAAIQGPTMMEVVLVVFRMNILIWQGISPAAAA